MSVVKDDRSAVAATPPDEGDRACRRGMHRRAAAGAYVDTGVKSLPRSCAARAEVGIDRAVHRPSGPQCRKYHVAAGGSHKVTGRCARGRGLSNVASVSAEPPVTRRDPARLRADDQDHGDRHHRAHCATTRCQLGPSSAGVANAPPVIGVDEAARVAPRAMSQGAPSSSSWCAASLIHKTTRRPTRVLLAGETARTAGTSRTVSISCLNGRGAFRSSAGRPKRQPARIPPIRLRLPTRNGLAGRSGSRRSSLRSPAAPYRSSRKTAI
jgi:hypothetical protein